MQLAVIGSGDVVVVEELIGQQLNRHNTSFYQQCVDQCIQVPKYTCMYRARW